MPIFDVCWRSFLKKLFTTAAVMVAFGNVAYGADFAFKAPIVASLYDWTGFYAGGTVGGAWSKADVNLTTVNGGNALYNPAQIPALNAIGSTGVSGSSVIFGGKLGYNQQWASFVLGVEGDISSWRLNKAVTTTGNPFDIILPPATVNFATFNTTLSTSWLATVRGRVGFAAGRALFYATGGAAFADIHFANTYLGHSGFGAGNEGEANTASQAKAGWAAGAGADYALTRNWIVSVEYLHVDLGSTSASGLVTTGNANTATMSFTTRLRSDIVRGGISYKF
jgi:outer membrane immunogenic protein